MKETIYVKETISRYPVYAILELIYDVGMLVFWTQAYNFYMWLTGEENRKQIAVKIVWRREQK